MNGRRTMTKNYRSLGSTLRENDMLGKRLIRIGFAGSLTLAITVCAAWAGNCLNSDAVPRLVAGDFDGIVYTPNLSFKNLSGKQCDGLFLLFEGDFQPAAGEFEFNGQSISAGTLPVSLAPGQGIFGQLSKTDAGSYQGFGLWRQSGDCAAGQDVALSADVQVGTLQDGHYRILDQIGFSTSSQPSQSWGFSARRMLLPEGGGVDSTAFSIAPCEEGSYQWTVLFFPESGVGQLTRQGTAAGPLPIFVNEVFGADLPDSFAGYVTVSVDKPSHLEALTVASGPDVQGGLQLSNFPVRPGLGTPYARHGLADDLHRALDQSRAANGLIGAAAAVLMPGQPLWTGASGNSTASGPLRAEMHFDIGSTTKNFVAALVLKLAEEGPLSLDDPLSRWLPGFAWVDNRATIRQLLNNTSGIYNFTENSNFWGAVLGQPGRSWTPREVLDYLGPPYFLPGADWRYSNTNYTLLGMIVQEATGSEVSSELRRRLLDPLGLADTVLPPEEPLPASMAHGWSDIDRDGVYVDFSLFPRTALHSATWTAGAMVSTPADLARWAQALFEGRVLAPDSLERMLDFVPVSVSGIPMTGYGLGAERIDFAGRTFWGHGGDIPGYAAIMLYEPQERVSIVLLFNQDETGAQGAAVLTALLEVLESKSR